MSLRTRLGLAGGAVVFCALLVASLILYPAIGSRLRDQIDLSLIQTAANSPQILDRLKQKTTEQGSAPAGSTGMVSVGSIQLQFVPPPVEPGPTDAFIPVTERDADVARLRDRPYFQDVSFRGVDYRVYTAPVPQTEGSLVRIARPRSDATATLGRLGVLLVVLTTAGGALALVVARLAADRVLRPVARLTETIEHVAATQELSARIAVRGDDEIGRLAGAFNAMMAELEDSVTAQRRLVADASHELRTPLTSLTTDLDLLADGQGLADPAAPELVGTAREQARRLGVLIGDLLDLARYGSSAHLEDVRLDLLAAHVVERASARAPGLRFAVDGEATLVLGDPDALERAVGNLLDNAVKWSPPGGAVHVRVRDGAVTVEDEGPGIDDADAPYVFDRFYRSAAARSRPGSGLGLAIVRQIAAAHGGTAALAPSRRGARLTLALPPLPAEAPPAEG
ncbi:HAMP domain-containing sensor histidine kinase [Microbispora corallina]|uniref:histidine kinase n=1 Tax=Microbispora corallina TaxID=83302 RepID=A0ABQ4G3U6_9ACTN|nr:HAMP domain-containing sensor histidine kinase [Microbispora corallina]GIH41722.1 two-component sensor histidine kinase [Microbispora corallina]